MKRLDYVLVSHFHGDHAGGLAALSRRVQIGSFIDHGESVDKASGAGGPLWDSYLTLAGKRRRTMKPGERLTLDGAELVIVAAHGQVLAKPLTDSGPNPLCESFKPQPEDTGENGQSLGYLFRAGKFEFVNLGDLSWNFQHKLACPVNLLGPVDLFQVTHHGVRDDVLPQQMWAMAPTVAVMNNGPTKGAGAVAVETVTEVARPGRSVVAAPGGQQRRGAQRQGAVDGEPRRHTGMQGRLDPRARQRRRLVRPHEQPQRPLGDVSRQVAPDTRSTR